MEHHPGSCWLLRPVQPSPAGGLTLVGIPGKPAVATLPFHLLFILTKLIS